MLFVSTEKIERETRRRILTIWYTKILVIRFTAGKGQILRIVWIDRENGRRKDSDKYY